jgi:hypothetical protein
MLTLENGRYGVIVQRNVDQEQDNGRENVKQVFVVAVKGKCTILKNAQVLIRAQVKDFEVFYV